MKYTTTSALALALLITVTGAANAYQSNDPLPARDSLDMNLFLTVQLPAYPDLPPFVAEARRVTVPYRLADRGTAVIRGEDVPRMIYATDDAPGPLKELTVIVEGMPATFATLDWTSYPVVRLYPLELRVRAYTAAAADLSRGSKPLVDLMLSDIALGTEEVCAEGLCSAGYIDAENLEAQLVFTAILPDTDYPAFNEWLADHPIIGELRMQIPNPFSTKN